MRNCLEPWICKQKGCCQRPSLCSTPEIKRKTIGAWEMWETQSPSTEPHIKAVHRLAAMVAIYEGDSFSASGADLTRDECLAITALLIEEIKIDGDRLRRELLKIRNQSATQEGLCRANA